MPGDQEPQSGGGLVLGDFTKCSKTSELDIEGRCAAEFRSPVREKPQMATQGLDLRVTGCISQGREQELRGGRIYLRSQRIG